MLVESLMQKSRMESLKEMLEKEPGDSFLNYAIALELEKENKILEAASILEKIIESNKNYLGAYYKLASLLFYLNEKEKAIIVLKNGVAVAKRLNDTKTMNELSELLLINEG